MTPTAAEFDDEWLMAYVDGELDDARRAAVELAIAGDPRLAARVATHRALRARVGAAHADALQEPVPDRLLAMLQAAGGRVAPDEPETAARAEGRVVDLAAQRAARRPGWRRPPQWLALAACLLLGVFAGRLTLPPGEPASFESRDGRLLARGPLELALTRQLASAPSPGAAVTVQLSFRSQAGPYCRSFALHGGELSGLACRDGSQWQVEVLARGARMPAEGALRQAGSPIAPEVLRAAEARMAGEPLDAAGERQALAAGWQP